ncbi:MAG: electron transport complex subunit RsxC [Thiotrichales bacterium]
MKSLSNWFLGGFRHGIHPAYHKDETRSQPIRRLPFALRLIVPVLQHIGIPARPVVRIGQEVVRGEVIAEADGWMSVPVHAPATGVVAAIEPMPSARGPRELAIIIDVYEADTQEVQDRILRDVDRMSPERVIQAVWETGMAGLGGAAFPSHVKLEPHLHKVVDTLVVNGSECEPYLTCDHRVMLERPDDLLRGVRLALRATGAKRAIIGIEDNKRDAADALWARLSPEDPITVQLVESKYPQGSERMLLKSLLGVEIPVGGFPADVGVVVNNVGTLAEVGRLLPRGEGLIERVVTVTGTAVAKPGNYIIPIGTPVGYVLETLGIEADHEKIILGGPMMGTSIASLEVPVTKGTSGILVFHERVAEQSADRQTYPCIKCGRCVQACPMLLNPAQLGWLAAKREFAQMEQEFYLNNCFECGCCSYVCPSNIPLVQQFRVAKAINRDLRERAS